MRNLAALLGGIDLILGFAPPQTILLITLGGGLLVFCLLFYGILRRGCQHLIESGLVLARGLLRTRRVIQDQIYARELTESIAIAGSLQDLRSLLDENASRFGFLAMEVCRERALPHPGMTWSSGGTPRAWKLDYPVTASASGADDPYVLRIWSDTARQVGPHAPERIARVLAPAIETWLRSGGPDAPSVVRRLPTVAARSARH